MTKKLIILNGPPRSGKDTCAMAISEALSIPHVKLSWPLKYIIADVLGLSQQMMEANKERGTQYELSPRQLQIALFQQVSKVFGDKWLASMLVTRIDRNSVDDVFVVSDCGRIPEVETVVNAFGADNVLLVRLFRKGTDFKNDIRGYVPVETVKHATSLHNNSTVDALRQKAIVAVGNFLEL